MAKKLSRGHPSHWLWAHPADSLNTWQRNFTRGHKKFKNEILDLFVIVGLWIKVKPRGRLTSISTKSIRLTSHWIWIRSSIVLNRSWWWTVFYSKLLLRSRELLNDAFNGASRTAPDAWAFTSGNEVRTMTLDPWLWAVFKPWIFCLFIPIDTFVNWLLSEIMIWFLTPTFKWTVFHITCWFL